MLSSKFSKFHCYFRLGIKNLFIVFVYRCLLKTGIGRRLYPVKSARAVAHFFVLPRKSPDCISFSSSVSEKADFLLRGVLTYFNKGYPVGSPPDWYYNPIQNGVVNVYDQHWSLLSEFNDEVGDVKCIWEPSRFDWMLVLAQSFQLTGKQQYLSCINEWVSDWCKKNPPNAGLNWKCGQEVSVRMLQVLLTAFILDQHVKPEDEFIGFIIDHLERVAPTIYYAIAQENNHGTSEAAALFVGGSWLLALKSELIDVKQARCWQKLGRKWLENRMASLVERDGSFSQYSVNYHRVLLDTISYVEFWRDLLKQPLFSDTFYKKARSATRWLYIFTDEKNGDAPNIGANDGTRLFNLTTVDYRDYRPSVQLASRLFMHKPAYLPGMYDETLDWLGLRFADADDRSLSMTKKPILFQDGGYCFLPRGKTSVFVRYPVFRFRPGHADALHVDLWHDGVNIIRDAGTYSYNTKDRWMTYFSGTQAHSTVEFDGRDQMVRVSRFLFGNWLRANHVSPIKMTTKGVAWSVGYKDAMGAAHRRELFVSEQKVLIKDQVKGFQEKAVVRWRLIPLEWSLDACTCSSDIATIRVSSTAANPHIEILTGYESRYYFQKSPLPVLTIEVNEECEIVTEIELHQPDAIVKFS